MPTSYELELEARVTSLINELADAKTALAAAKDELMRSNRQAEVLQFRVRQLSKRQPPTPTAPAPAPAPISDSEREARERECERKRYYNRRRNDALAKCTLCAAPAKRWRGNEPRCSKCRSKPTPPKAR